MGMDRIEHFSGPDYHYYLYDFVHTRAVSSLARGISMFNTHFSVGVLHEMIIVINSFTCGLKVVQEL